MVANATHRPPMVMPRDYRLDLSGLIFADTMAQYKSGIDAAPPSSLLRVLASTLVSGATAIFIAANKGL